MLNRSWEGVHTALVTPFSNDALDLSSFGSLLQHQLDGGVQGVVVCGTTGETPTLENEEWELLLRETVAQVGGRARVSAGVGSNSTRSTVRNVERAQALGVEAGLLVLPYYNKPTPEGLFAHVRAAAAPGLPLIVYHVPGRTGQRVAPELLAELCNLPGVVACKEATGDLSYGQDLMLGTATPVLSGDDFTWLPLLSVGSTGVISVLSNVVPRLTVAVWEAWRRGDVTEAARIHRQLYPLVRYLFAQSNPVPVKAALAAMGLCSAECRLPLTAGKAPAPALLVGLS